MCVCVSLRKNGAPKILHETPNPKSGRDAGKVEPGLRPQGLRHLNREERGSETEATLAKKALKECLL